MHRTSLRPIGVAALAAGLWLWCCGIADAQHWPSEPVALAGGRLLIGGDASATFGSEDPGWFTYTDYETSAIRRMRAGVTVEARLSPHVSLLAEVRAETGAGVTPYAWYVRVNPLDSGLVSIQAGRIPPVFGTFARRSYPQDNPLIGDPLVYQYLTSVRPDAVPATADDLLRMRGRGWRVRYPVGEPYAEAGVPVIAGGRWDTGIQARVGGRILEGAVAYTVGSLAHPLVKNDNRGGQTAGRLAWRPAPALTIGVSAASGNFLGNAVLEARPDVPAGPYDQRAFGVDAETSWGRWLFRGEYVANSWRLPALDPPQITGPIESRSWYLESKVRLGPRVYLAARGDRSSFSSIRGSASVTTWDADVSRVEIGAGFTVRRGLVAKASAMNNWRDGGNVRQSLLGAVQVLFWF
jgi:hypothetical protein